MCKKRTEKFHILCLFSVGANCVRLRAFTELPYEDDFLSVVKPALWKASLRLLFLFLFFKSHYKFADIFSGVGLRDKLDCVSHNFDLLGI